MDTNSPHENDSQSNTPEKKESFGDILRFTLLSLLVVIPFRMFIAQPFIVSGLSMDPTFKNGDYLIVDQITPRLNGLERGNVIVFRYPLNESRSFIKRVIGLPGETLEIEEGIVTIKNSEHPEGFTLDEPYVLYQRNFTATLTLKDTEYFVMGDNRDGSLDSRIWGPLERRFIIGRPLFQLFPIADFGFAPGSVTYEKQSE